MRPVNSQSSAIVYSVAMHALIVLAFALDIDLWHSPAAPTPNAIQATVVDPAVLEQTERAREAELERQREAELEQQREEAERQAELERQREEAEREAEVERQREEAEREAQLERQREAERQVELERQREEAERQAELERQREAERQAELERQRREEAERQAELERQRREEAERQAELERQRQAELEADLQRQLAAETEQNRLREAGLLDQYIRDIENVIRQNWIRPGSAQPGIECVVNVTQIPSGDVVGVSIGRCNGDAAVVRSIESAVLRASPLPRPPDPALFERNLEVTFSPDE